MLLSKRSLWLSLVLLAIVALPAHAKKGGGGKPGGGGDPPPPPLIQYQLQILEMPADSVGDTNAFGMNNSGDVTGYYTDANNRYHAFLYTSTIDPTPAVDLNTLVFDPNFDIPAGWYLAVALDVNDQGDVVGVMGETGSAFGDVHRGFVIKRSGEGSPKLMLLPDEAWGYAWARQINELGDVAGVFRRDGGGAGSYVFNPGLYGPADNGPHVLPFDTGSIYLNNLGQVAGFTLAGPAFRYTLGAEQSLELFPEIDHVVDSTNSITGINDAGVFCGRVVSQSSSRKGKSSSLETYRYGTQLDLISNAGTLFPSAINLDGDLASWNNRSIYHEGTELIALDENVLLGDSVDVAMYLSARWVFHSDITERGALNDLAPNFPGICGHISVSDVGAFAFILTPVPVH